ncbi:MAG TPA: sigma-70 family RNA polymerase sigma factor [Actinomycetota bacterium]|nr:sigma-70 family RNA polymerase sigma factor [Actinomycetota bacterium]
MAPPPELTAFCTDEHPRLVGMLGLYLGDRALAEELAQEALLRACRDWRRLQEVDDRAAWLRRVAFNLANSYFRRRLAERRARERLERRPRMSWDPDPVAAVAVRRAVAALPRRQRTAIILRFYLDMTLADVALAMDVPVSTAKSLCSRGLARLRASAGLTDFEEVRHARP